MTVVLDMMPVHFDGIIALNGQYCFDDHGLLEKESLLPEDIVTITRWLDEHPDVVANYCEKDYVYFNQITDAMRATWRQLGKTAPTVNIDDPHERALKYETFQISPYISFEDEAKLSGMCRNVRGVRWHPDFTDLIPADGGKPEGMKRSCGITAGRVSRPSRSETAATTRHARLRRHRRGDGQCDRTGEGRGRLHHR